jgi:hypothetical protein
MVKVVKRVTAYALFLLLGLTIAGPAFAHAPKMTKAQKDAQKYYARYNKQYIKQQKKELKAQEKQMKKWNREHGTKVTVI